MQGTHIVRVGGWCLIIFTVLMAGLLITNDFLFDYPFSLGGNLPATMHQALHYPALKIVLTLQSVLPLLLIPGAVGVYELLKKQAQGGMRVALYFALIGSFAWVISLMVWPSLNWYIAQGVIRDWGTYHSQMLSGSHHSQLIVMLIGGLTSLMHLYIGVYLKVLVLSLWVFMISCIGYREKSLWCWLCGFGIILAVVAWIALLVQVLFGNPLVVMQSFDGFPIFYLWLFLLGVNLTLKK